MKVYLVINNSGIFPKTREEQYNIFEDKDRALEYAKSKGYDNPIPLDDKVGVMNFYQCEDIDINILPLSIK